MAPRQGGREGGVTRPSLKVTTRGGLARPSRSLADLGSSPVTMHGARQGGREGEVTWPSWKVTTSKVTREGLALPSGPFQQGADPGEHSARETNSLRGIRP